MKEFVVTQMKHGVSIFIEDADNMVRQTIDFTWKEIAGLKWAIDDITHHPAFQHREPKERVHRGGVQRKFVEHIKLVDSEE